MFEPPGPLLRLDADEVERARPDEVEHEDLAALERDGYLGPQHVRDVPARAPARKSEIDVHSRVRVRAREGICDVHGTVDALGIVGVADGFSGGDFERDGVRRSDETDRREGVHCPAPVSALEYDDMKCKSTHLPCPSYSPLRGRNGIGRRPSQRLAVRLQRGSRTASRYS